MIAHPSTRTIGDLINAIAAVFEPEPDSVDETGLTVVIGGRLVRVSFLTEPNRYDVTELDRFASAAAAYDGGPRS
jgi:hypothetical protein